jgi:cobalt/nickel transport system permease protein
VAAALRAFLTPGDARWVIPIAGHALAISDAGLAQAAAVFSRVLATTLVAVWLTSTTPFPHLVAALVWARVPAALLDLLLLAHRHRHACRDSLETIRCAQTLRLGYAGLRRGVASAGVLVGAAVCRAIDQAGATAEAMQLRGDRGAGALALPERSPAADAFVVGCGAMALTVSAVLAWSSPW